MPAGRIVVPPYFPTRDMDGYPVSGAKLYVYQNNTDTLVPVYSTDELSTPIANPVVANASGQFPPVWAEAGTEDAPVLYSLAVTTADGSAPGRPSVFDDYRPSVDFETATLALAEQASASAQQNADIAAQAVLDIIALEAGDVTPITNRALRDGSNITDPATFRNNIGTVSTSGVGATSSFTNNLVYNPSASGALQRVVYDKLNRSRSILDFMSDDPAADAAANVTRLNAALASGVSIDLTEGMGGRFKIAGGPIILPDRAALVGPTSSGVVFERQAGYAGPTFSIRGSRTTVAGLYVDHGLAQGLPVFGSQITGDMEEMRLFDIQTRRAGDIFLDTGITGKYLRTYVSRITAFEHCGKFVNFTRAWAFNEWGLEGAVTCDFNGSPSPNFTAFGGTGGALGVAEGGLYIYAHVGGTAAAGATTSQRAFNFLNMPSVTIRPGSTSDSCGGGSVFDGCPNLSLLNPKFGLSNDHQLIIRNCLYVEGAIETRGRKGLSGAAAAKDGVRWEGTSAQQTLIINSFDNTGHGAQQVDATVTQIVVPGGRMTSNGLKGLYTNNGGALNFSSLLFADNVGGNGEFRGALHQVVASMNGAGGYLNQSGIGVF